MAWLTCMIFPGMARTRFPIGFHFQRLKIVRTGRAMLP